MGELYQRSEIEHTKRNSVQYNYLIDQNLGDVGHCYIVLVYNAALEGGGGGSARYGSQPIFYPYIVNYPFVVKTKSKIVNHNLY